jgi:integrase
MGARGQAGGIENHREKVRLRFQYQGRRHSVSLDLPFTPRNVKHAQRLMAEIHQKIRFGVFNPAEYFPNWSGLAKIGAGPVGASATFGEYADLWLKGQRLAYSTVSHYRSSLDTHWLPSLKERPLQSIRHSELLALMGEDGTFLTNKTRNNALIALRGVFALARRDRVIDHDPTTGIKNGRHQAEPADPFTREEADLVIGWFEKRGELEKANYFEFAFYTGLRCPSEIIELSWGDVDLRSETIKISRAHVQNRTKDTKTHVSRIVNLHPRALAALERQRPSTQLAGGFVFVNPETRERYHDGWAQWNWFKAACKATKIRYRVPYQTRHSFATWRIMDGANPTWLAEQLGHSVIVLHKTYAKWIRGSDESAREVAKMKQAAIGPKVAPKTIEIS